ncbi:MAG: helix-turn-helix domain-containing protein [Oscillospiraceae bacterium]|jgi:transcriptional regulator with XRE-family HTH domain|nr:helix-turn-helix domain-containing protein [Oscillospiraceae bacterium]
MSVHFSEKLKQLRSKRDLTQEQIADIFHVSPQSVSRWETGANYPDIEILPHIAIFFKVTVDELLGTEALLGEEQVSEYIKTIRNLLNSGKLSEAVHASRAAVREYPVNYDLQMLQMQSLCAFYADETIENAEKRKEIIAIGERIINYSTDQNISLWAKWQLFRQYIKWNMREEAKKILTTLPSEVWYTQDANAGYVLDGEEWRKNQQLRIIRFTILLGDFMREYAEKADLSPLERINCLKTNAQIESLVGATYGDRSGGNSTASIDSAFANIRLAELYCEAGDGENALQHIEIAARDSLRHVETMDTTNDDGSNYFAWSTPRNLCWILWEDYLIKPQFDTIRTEARFINCFELLKSNSRELK